MLTPTEPWAFYRPLNLKRLTERMMTDRTFMTALIACCLFASSLAASGIVDPAGDFLPTYTGPRNGDLDILEAEAFFNPTENMFRFTSTSNGPIGSTPGGVFVWGVNRGAGFVTFPGIGEGITLDAVLVIVPGGDSFTLMLDTSVITPIPMADVTIDGSVLSAVVPLAAMPSLGAAPQGYTVNLFPRSEEVLIDENIADFAPDNSNAAVTVVPEPETWLLLTAGGGVLLIHRKRRAA
jgi:hypothetical protein